jgi:hypothetical protein
VFKIVQRYDISSEFNIDKMISHDFSYFPVPQSSSVRSIATFVLHGAAFHARPLPGANVHTGHHSPLSWPLSVLSHCLLAHIAAANCFSASSRLRSVVVFPAVLSCSWTLSLCLPTLTCSTLIAAFAAAARHSSCLVDPKSLKKFMAVNGYIQVLGRTSNAVQHADC